MGLFILPPSSPHPPLSLSHLPFQVFTPRHVVNKKPASKSLAKKKTRGRMSQPQPLNIDDSPLNASPLKNHVEEPKLHDQFVYITPPNEDVSNVPIEDLFSVRLVLKCSQLHHRWLSDPLWLPICLQPLSRLCGGLKIYLGRKKFQTS